MVYGDTLSGKTNLAHALMDVKEVLLSPFQDSIPNSGIYHGGFFYYTFKINNHIVTCNYVRLSGGEVVSYSLNFRDAGADDIGVIRQELLEYVEQMIWVPSLLVDKTEAIRELCWDSEGFKEFLKELGVDSRFMRLDHTSISRISLESVYYSLLGKDNSGLIFIDDFDSYFDYGIAVNFLKYLKKRFSNAQIIMSTHNTRFISNEFFRPDCIFFLSKENGLTSLDQATKRELKRGHNLEKMFIAGEFGRR